jgi:hypothetical protein
MVDLTRKDYEEAVKRGQELARQPRAVSACFDAQRNRVIIRLTTGIEIGFAPQDAEGLESASNDQLASVMVRENGLGLHFPLLDADLYVPALLDGWLGSRRWATSRAAE